MGLGGLGGVWDLADGGKMAAIVLFFCYLSLGFSSHHSISSTSFQITSFPRHCINNIITL